MLSSSELCSVLERAGVPTARAASRSPRIREALVLAEATTDKRIAAFLGQVAHETLLWRYQSEIWGPTRVQLRYDRDFSLPWPRSPQQARLSEFAGNRLAYTLGNVRPGDGSRYRGRGDIQVTGRTNYRCATKRLRTVLGESVPDFEVSPQILSAAEWASLCAADYWIAKGLNTWADAEDDRELTRRINGGFNGLGDRMTRRLFFLSVLKSG